MVCKQARHDVGCDVLHPRPFIASAHVPAVCEELQDLIKLAVSVRKGANCTPNTHHRPQFRLHKEVRFFECFRGKWGRAEDG